MENRFLFRGKRIDNGEWVEGYLSYPFCTKKGNESYYFYAKDSLGFFCRCVVDASTICQCTGLKDKNGKLIWENDIIHKPFYTDHDAYANSEAYTGRIQYKDCGWSVEITKSDGSVCVSPIIEMIAYSKDIEHFEVIGNIFDNPELLEV